MLSEEKLFQARKRYTKINKREEKYDDEDIKRPLIVYNHF